MIEQQYVQDLADATLAYQVPNTVIDHAKIREKEREREARIKAAGGELSDPEKVMYNLGDTLSMGALSSTEKLIAAFTTDNAVDYLNKLEEFDAMRNPTSTAGQIANVGAQTAGMLVGGSVINQGMKASKLLSKAPGFITEGLGMAAVGTPQVTGSYGSNLITDPNYTYAKLGRDVSVDALSNVVMGKVYPKLGKYVKSPFLRGAIAAEVGDLVRNAPKSYLNVPGNVGVSSFDDMFNIATGLVENDPVSRQRLIDGVSMTLMDAAFGVASKASIYRQVENEFSTAESKQKSLITEAPRVPKQIEYKPTPTEELNNIRVTINKMGDAEKFNYSETNINPLLESYSRIKENYNTLSDSDKALVNTIGENIDILEYNKAKQLYAEPLIDIHGADSDPGVLVPQLKEISKNATPDMQDQINATIESIQSTDETMRPKTVKDAVNGIIKSTFSVIANSRSKMRSSGNSKTGAGLNIIETAVNKLKQKADEWEKRKTTSVKNVMASTTLDGQPIENPVTPEKLSPAARAVLDTMDSINNSNSRFQTGEAKLLGKKQTILGRTVDGIAKFFDSQKNIQSAMDKYGTEGKDVRRDLELFHPNKSAETFVSNVADEITKDMSYSDMVMFQNYVNALGQLSNKRRKELQGKTYTTNMDLNNADVFVKAVENGTINSLLKEIHGKDYNIDTNKMMQKAMIYQEKIGTEALEMLRGVLSDESIENLKQVPFYMRTERLRALFGDSEDPSDLSTPDLKGILGDITVGKNPTSNIKGSTPEAIDLLGKGDPNSARNTDIFETALHAMNRVFAAKQKNLLNESLDNLLHSQKFTELNDASENPMLMRYTDDHSIPVGYQKVKWYKDGAEKNFLVRSDTAKEINNIPSSDAGRVLGWITGARPTKLLSVAMNPSFFKTSFPMDLFSAWGAATYWDNATQKYKSLYSANPLKFMSEMGEDLKVTLEDTWNNTGYAKTFAEAGLQQFTIVEQAKILSRKLPVIGKNLSSPESKVELISQVWRDIQGVITKPNEFMENWVRNAMARRAMDVYGLGVRDAAWTARRVRDYARGSKALATMDEVFPFIKAAVNSTRPFVRLIKTNPEEAAIRGGIVLTASMLTKLMAMGSNPQAYEDIPDDVKNSGFVFFTGASKKDKDGNTQWHYLTLPVDQTMRPLLAVGNQITNVYLGKEADMGVVGSSVLEMMKVVDVNQGPPTLKAMYGALLNKNVWTGKDLWSGPEVSDKRLEYNEYTGALPVLLGKMSPFESVSPTRIAYAAKQLLPQSNMFIKMGNTTAEHLAKQIVPEYVADVERRKGLASEEYVNEITSSLPGMLSKYTLPKVAADNKNRNLTAEWNSQIMSHQHKVDDATRNGDITAGYQYISTIQDPDIMDSLTKKLNDKTKSISGIGKFVESIKNTPLGIRGKAIASMRERLTEEVQKYQQLGKPEELSASQSRLSEFESLIQKIKTTKTRGAKFGGMR